MTKKEALTLEEGDVVFVKFSATKDIIYKQENLKDGLYIVKKHWRPEIEGKKDIVHEKYVAFILFRW